ncbi:MAG TPA: tRNA guanosine(34) transglycosylase Tgt, partial [Dehalococcoidia bacterium]
PEDAVAVQEALGADVIMAFDEPPPPTASYQEAAAATERTHRWAERCLAALRTDQALFAICQGGMFEELRRESARFVAGLDVPGCAVGGLSIGEPKEVTWRMLAASLAELPRERPRYLMGVGSPEDVVRAAGMGVDLFDCVLPTRVARNGACFTPEGRINLKNARWAEERGPVDPACDCYTCARFSLAYLHHLFRAEELLAYRLATIHNLRFMARLMADLRAAITAGRYREFAAAFLARYRPADEEARREQKAKWLAARVLSGPPSEGPWTDGGAGAPAEG